MPQTPRDTVLPTDETAELGIHSIPPPGAAADLGVGPVGRNIGTYRILERLGGGGMGVVYRAEHLRTGRQVALKTVRAPNELALSSLRREIHTLARAHHPQVVSILDEGVDRGLPWYAMELLEGTTLRRFASALAGTTDILPQPSPAPGAALPEAGHPQDLRSSPRTHASGSRLGLALTLVRRLCSPLSFLHGEGIVHRDLKPANILIRPAGGPGAPPGSVGIPVLVDFGLVSQFGGRISREALEVAGAVVGTVAYMAPEQARGELVDVRADLCALGCILYELLTGRPPFLGQTAVQVLLQHLEAKPGPPSKLATGVPAALDALVLRLLAKRPRERLGHAGDVAAALDALGAEDGLAAAGPRPRAYLYRPGFVGREEALRKLEARLDRLHEGDGGLVLVGGESGTGKTRFVMELARLAEQQDMIVLAGECFDAAARPLEGLRRPLQALADRCREGGVQETDRLLGRRGKVLAQYEPALRELPGQEAWPEPADLPPEAARLRLFGLLAETLCVLAEDAPVLLILDDLQWADELTLGWLGHLVRHRSAGTGQAAPFLIAGTYRTEEIGTTGLEHLGKLLDSPQVGHVALGRMEEAAVAAMIADMLALESAPQAFSRYLMRHSEGNPFFIAEYLRSAVTEGLLWRDDQGHWQVAEAGERTATEADYERLRLPHSLRALVERRLQGLEAPTLQAAEAAAVIGREISGSLLGRMLESAAEKEAAPLMEAVAELLRRQVLEEPGPGYLRFAHDKIREVAYEGIALPRRAQLHRAAAEGIEAIYGKEDHLAALGHHWEQAGKAEQARDLYLAAARKAKRRCAYVEAERLYRAYLRLVAEPSAESVEARIELGAGIIHVQSRNLEAIQELRLALDVTRRLSDRALEASVLNALGFIYSTTGPSGQAFAFSDQALAISREVGARKTEAMVLRQLAGLQWEAGRFEEALRLCEQALDLHREDGDRRQEGFALNLLGTFHGELDHPELAGDLYEKAMAICREFGDRVNEGAHISGRGVLLYYQGRLEEAESHYLEALAIHRETGFRIAEGAITASLGLLRAGQGLLEQAWLLYEQALAVLREAGDQRICVFIFVSQAALHRRLGQLPAAQLRLEQAEPFLRKDETHLAICLCEQGHLALAAGQPARDLAAKAQRHAPGGRATPCSGPGKALGRLQRAVDAAEAGRPLFRGECLEDVPEGLRRWLEQNGQL